MSTPVPLVRRLAAHAACRLADVVWRRYPFSKASIWPEVLTLLASFGVSASVLSFTFFAGMLAASLARPVEHAPQAWSDRVVVHAENLDYDHYAHTPEGLRASVEAVHGIHSGGGRANIDTGEP